MLTNWYLQRVLQDLNDKASGVFHVPSTAALIELSQVQAVVFPSTSFFYAGNPELSQFFAFQDQTMDVKQQVLGLAAGLAAEAQGSSFKPIVAAAKSMGLSVREVEVDQIAPLGLVGKLDRTWYILGDEACMAQEGIELGMSVQTLARRFQQEGKYSIFLAQKQPKRLLGVFACFYPLHSKVLGVAEMFHKEGVAVELLTTLKSPIALTVAHQLGISLLQSELSAEEKQLALMGIQNQQPKSAVVMAGTDVQGGIALQLPSGELAWAQSLQELPMLIQAGQQGMRRLKQRLFWVTLE
jgi:cation transport ATPase